MKLKLILLFITCSLLSCKNKQEKQLDWKQIVEKEINQFENDKSVLKEGELISGRQVIKYLILTSEDSKITKYDMTSNFGETFPMKEEVYLKDGKIFYSKWSGLSPYISKGVVNDNSLCCAVFEDKTYFKSPKKAIILKKKIDLKDAKEYSFAKKTLDTMGYKQEELKQAYPAYDRLLRTVEMIAQ